ncbi:MAG: patatin-like protein [Zoogloeaceae bacterium]|nr:patatin-like protein [Zoogloeaceae bacterium]
MNDSQTTTDGFHEQELRIALVMNGGVSLAVWIGGVAQEINRLVRGETIYGRLCRDLSLRPRVDIISGTSAGGINGALLALAMTQGKPLDPLRDIWRDSGDILSLLRQPTQDDPTSLLDGGYFYKELLEGFTKIIRQPGRMQPPDQVPIDLTLTTTVLRGEVRDFPDDVGTLIRDVTHRGQIKFRRGPDVAEDPFNNREIVTKLATAARCTASFPGAFEPFYLPAPGDKATAGGAPVASLDGHTNFTLGCFVVDGGVLDNNPLESAIDAVFQQRAEGEVRRVLAYVVPDPGRISDPPSEKTGQIPSMASTVLASLVNIPRVETISHQLRAITEHNQKVSQQRDTRLLVARSLGRDKAIEIARAVFPGYRLRRIQSAADYIANALADGAGRYRDGTGQGVALGRRSRQQITRALTETKKTPWVPDTFDAPSLPEWRWGLFTLDNIMSVVLDMLRRGIGLVPARRSESTNTVWNGLMEARCQAYSLVAKIAVLRRRDQGHWLRRGIALAPQLASLERGKDEEKLPALLESELLEWVRLFDDRSNPSLTLAEFSVIAQQIGQLLVYSLRPLQQVLDLGVPRRFEEKYSDLKTLVEFFTQPLTQKGTSTEAACQHLLTLEVVHYAFGADNTRDQYLELVQFSANVSTAFGGPSRLEDKLTGVQLGHFGAFYKRAWRINDWMFGRLDGAERLVRILMNPARLYRLYGCEKATGESSVIEAILDMLHGTVLYGLKLETDRILLQLLWERRLPAMRDELDFLTSNTSLPEYLPECSAMVLERLHLDILRDELPALADAIGDDEVDGADGVGNGPKFLKRFRNALANDCSSLGGKISLPVSAANLPAEVIVQLFKDANVGKEKLLDEAGTDRFTITAARSAAVAVSALAGKSSGLKGLRSVFSIARAPLVALDILIHVLTKKSKTHVFVALYCMAMAASAVILLAEWVAGAHWYGVVTLLAGAILAGGLIVGLHRYPKLLVSILAMAILFWQVLPIIQKCVT